ncbi:concanavalin A-like lectin/glucanase, partial [Metschnikowia bicuspidata]
CFSRNQALPALVSASMTTPDPHFQEYETCPLICYNSTGATFLIRHRFENPQLVSLGYIYHGSVEADILAAPGTGIILSFYLQSDDKDEIDIAEIFGNNHLLFQTNYFSKGDVSTNGKGIYVSISSSPLYNFHRYGVRWTPDEIEWTVDGASVRHVKRVSGEGFPESPMRVRFSMWVGGDLANEPGTVTWAGGLTDFADSPFRMYIRNVTVENSGGGQDYTY